MTRLDWTSLRPEAVDPERLTLLLQEHGWTRRGGRPGSYSRWVLPGREPDEARASVIVPLNRSAADFAELLQETLTTLWGLAPSSLEAAAGVLDELARVPGDQIRFRKDVATVNGAVAWPLGHELVEAARASLVAGAKARLSKRAYYGNANGRFAKRFIESVLMGQTEIGSYVVTAFSPPDQTFPEKETPTDAPSLPFIASYTGRQIVDALVDALSATQEAVEHFERQNSFAGFEQGVHRGVSRELTDALQGMVSSAEAAEVTVDWSPTLHAEAPRREITQFEFSGGIAEILRQASERLATAEPAEYVSVIGWVRLLARPKRGENGLVSLRVISGSEANSIRVPLSEEQFEVAAEAITHDMPLTVSGRQEREGNRYWLYNASGLGVTELPPNQRYLDELRRAMRGQQEIDLDEPP
jgi:hypothetical protein